MYTIHTAPTKFVTVIKNIADAYGFDLSNHSACLYLSKSASNLTIEKLDSKIIRVGQYRELGLFKHPSPEIEFIIEDLIENSDFHKYWTPLRMTQGISFRQVTWVNSEGIIIDVDVERLEEATILCDRWAERISSQSWINLGQPAPGVTASYHYIADSDQLRGLRGFKIFTT